jgi:predicted metal-binding protein
MTTWITVCDTCKCDGWETGDMSLTDGERLADLVEAAATGRTDVRTRRVSCMLGCERSCNIAVQAAGKLSFTLGRFAPDEGSAQAIVDWAALHADSASGQVPYRTWPEGVKGHFVARLPPLPDDG